MKLYTKLMIAVVIALGCFAISARAQDSGPMTLRDAVNGYQSVTNGHAGLPEDWSSHHLVFSQPASGTAAYDKVMHDPRYWMQQVERLRPQSEAQAVTDMQLASRILTAAKHGKRWRRKHRLKRDWNVSLGAGGTVGSEMYPAKFTFAPPGTPDCTNDFVVFNTNLAGSASQASIVGFNNIYNGICSPTVPHVNWAYNTGGTAKTSVVLSLDGTQVAFVQTEGSTAHLILLKWKANDGTVASPTTLTSTAAASYRACTAPCMTDFTFSPMATPPNDTNSAPYVDYFGDTLYVGADNGTLHKFTGVFAGTPAEAISPWPVAVHSSTVLSSPVFDANSGKIFVGDAGGQLSAVTVSSGALASTTTNFGTNHPIVDAPLVDGSTEKVFWFGGANANNKGATVIEQTDTSLGTPELVSIGNATGQFPNQRAHGGAFDNAYFTSTSPSITGFLYVCGVTATGADTANLYRIGFSGTGLMNTSTASGPLAMSSSTSECSPITEFRNGSTDRIFLGVTANGNLAGTCSGTCTGGGCLYSFDVTSTFPTTCSAKLASSGGTSGVIIDNDNGTSGASQVYFTPLTGNNGATQASQAELN